MKEEIFEDRRRALEEAFFKKHNQAVLDRLKAQERRLAAKQSITEATGIQDDALLTRLVDLGFEASTLLSFRLVPAIEVAWADGGIDEAERVAILERLAQAGVTKDSPAYEMVESWLKHRPPADVFDTWVAYTRELVARLSPADRKWVESSILNAAEDAAQASGGFLGIVLRTSKAEKEVIEKIRAAFAV